MHKNLLLTDKLLDALKHYHKNTLALAQLKWVLNPSKTSHAL